MALTVGGTPVKSVYVGSTPVKAVYVGSQKVWPVGPRTVTINSNAQYGFATSATGDTDLVGGWPTTVMGQGVSFVAPVTCTRQVAAPSNYQTFIPGSTIPAGTGVVPSGYNPTMTPFVFTEVL